MTYDNIDDFIATAEVGSDLRYKAYLLGEHATTGLWHYTRHSTPEEAVEAITTGLPGMVAHELRKCSNGWEVEWVVERQTERGVE